MINAVKHQNEITKCNPFETFAVNKITGKIVDCHKLNCRNCLFNNQESCSRARVKWLLSEYKKPIKLTKYERAVLNRAYELGYRYIIREPELSRIFVTKNMPIKSSFAGWTIDGIAYTLMANNKDFRFVKVEDKEPYSIDELLRGDKQ